MYTHDKQMLSTEQVKALGFNNAKFVSDIAKGSTLGIGLKTISLDAATPLVMPPAIIVVLQTPAMYDKDTVKIRTLKALLETHATNFSGIDVEYNLDTADSPLGHDGQPLQVPTQTKRSPISPSATIPEVTGNLVWRFFNNWVWNISDPDTGQAFQHLANTSTNLPFVSSSYSMTMAVIQFDPSRRPENIIDGAFCANMFPTSPGGPIGFERAIGTSNTRERNVVFSAHLRHNARTRDLMVEIAKELKLGSIAGKTGGMPTADYVKDFVKSSQILEDIANAGKVG
jgi:hypothetical protein